ncbi:phosphohistidine phosphatase SixA [Leptolyngbya sp. FACHB-36]|uniref:phosphohistidine phosphatase SixA n=1 Tax=Leptolyngbya sp. FACHB-36 TaxID=2692808 RepID=UPI001680CA0D|nr:phosphohistidine phosphatase SixA [Leptolyngbya sp. FACHB-36]MBD2022339.1 phosphohistidine phosphatase SixA [Leptolyngbya sp. FACHB-36]
MASVDLYLVRHGLAGEHGTYPNDDERPLTDEGKKKTRQVAKRLRELDVRFDWMLTSPLVRARQTAEILMDVGLAGKLEEADFLAHGGTIDHWLDWLQNWRAIGQTTLALVGHEPDLSAWAETLLWGEVKGVLRFKKAGIMGLTLPEGGSPVGNSSLFWLTPPRFLL